MTDLPIYGVLLFGAPGVGKGTQGKILGTIPGFYHLSVGEVFRSIDIGSPDGREIYQHTSRGELVPDDLTMKIWRRNLEGQTILNRFKPHEDILILDGLPRNIHQAQLLTDHVDILHVIYLVCNDQEEMIHRIKRRAIRENRSDDANEDIIRHRYKVYHSDTAPVVEHYDKSIVHEVEAMGSPAEVLSRILEVLIPVQNSHYQTNMKRRTKK
ncbi:Adenylate kinase [Polystyrenella longa]|uniref:Adenylate kinase n=1 Tax=Polystyrenella longa TaxID=2528007 RepID=A0A518CSF1_9PLAN|nr:nucleoside monophosphate kinase [Polystyrenella longa]QDU82148.1 Adenylate kinase [Polystyrenella longa]